MPRAGPDANPEEVLHLINPDDSFIATLHGFGDQSASNLDEITWINPISQKPVVISSFTRKNFTFRVERGCLGEVESLVGDCRPPPPGNPRRPTCGNGISHDEGKPVNYPGEGKKGILFSRNLNIRSEFTFHDIRHCSFNSIKILPNLKKLNKCQYFKNFRSFFTCGCPPTMLILGTFPLPSVRALISGIPAYSDYICSKD